MRTDAIVEGTAQIAIKAKNLIAGRIFLFLEPVVHGRAAPFQFALLFRTAIDVIDSQKAHISFPATGTLTATVGFVRFSAQSQVPLLITGPISIAIILVVLFCCGFNFLDILTIVEATEGFDLYLIGLIVFLLLLQQFIAIRTIVNAQFLKNLTAILQAIGRCVCVRTVLADRLAQALLFNFPREFIIRPSLVALYTNFHAHRLSGELPNVNAVGQVGEFA